MADVNLGFLSHVINSTFISGLVCGVSIAWLFLKIRSKVLPENSEFSPKVTSTFSEVSCFRMFCMKRAFCYLRLTIIRITMFQPTGDDEDNFKLVLIVRSDLKMGKGKAAAQVEHIP
jgi:hypothetical protein